MSVRALVTRARLAPTGPIRSVHKFVRPFEDVKIDNTYMPGPGKVFIPYKAPALSTPVHDLQTGKVIGEVDLNAKVWNQEIRKDIVHRVVLWQTARRRDKNNEGVHTVKHRAEVRSSGRKLYKQKGTGKARTGAASSPIRRGGGKAHGPRPRTFEFDLPREVRRIALRCALTAKFMEKNLFVVRDLMLNTHKTNHFIEVLQHYKVHRPYIVHAEGELDPNMILAGRNLQWVDFMPQVGCNVYDLLRHHELIITEQALKELEERLVRIKNPPKYIAPKLEDLIASGEVKVTVPLEETV